MSHEAYNWARDLPIKGPRGKRSVLKSLADHANEHWASWPSKKLIAKETDLNPATVSNYLRDLVHDGAIVPVPWCNEEGGDAGSGYYLMGAPNAPEFTPVKVAFKDRRYGHPRGFTPSWWSGSKADESETIQDPLWGEGHTDMRGGQHPYEGEGHTGVRGRVTPVGPLEPSGEPPVEPSIKRSAPPAAPASAEAEAGTLRSNVWADADGADPAAADAAPRHRSSTDRIPAQRSNRSAGKAGGADSTKTKPTASQQRDADRQARIDAMPSNRVEDVLTKYAKTRPKGYEWASQMARKELGLNEDPEYGSEGYEGFLRRVYWWALKFHNRGEDWPQVLLWALDDEAVVAAEEKAALRRERVLLLKCEPGAEDKVLDDMYKAVNAMPPADRAVMAEDIQRRKPRVWADAYAAAEDQLLKERGVADATGVVRLAMQYVVLHYRDSRSKEWPSFVVPPAIRAAMQVARAA